MAENTQKESKAKAHYRGGHGDHYCRNCTMFRSPNACTAVEGYISPEGLCDLFKRKQHKK